MFKHNSLKKLLLLVSLMLALAVVPVALAQDATEAPAGEVENPVDDTQDAAGEGVAAEEAEAQEVGGEDVGQEEDTEDEAVAAETEGGSTSPLIPLGINTGFLVAQIINFLIIFAGLYFGLWPRLVNMLDSRSARIQKGLEDAAAAANARRNAEAEAEKIIAAARTEASRVIDEARGRGEEVARSIEADARAAAERIRAEGSVRANEERDRQLADLRGQVASIATAMAQRLIGESIDAKRQQALVNDFFTRVPASERKLTGAVTVTSAMPLTPEEQQRIQRELGTDVAAFTVDPSILGGLVIRSEDRVVDGSVRSNLQEMAGRLR